MDTLKCGIIQERGAFSIARTNKKYTPEFKIEVIETKIKERLSCNETAKRFNLYNTVKGYQYPASNRIHTWKKFYLEEGKEGFYKEKRGKGNKGKGGRPKLEQKVEEDLSAKCQRLEMENEYIKKLSALVSAREQKSEIALLVRELSAKFPLTELLKLSGIPRSTYYYF